MLEKGATDINSGLLSACQGGNIEIVKLMLEKGSNRINHGLYHACDGGHKEIVELMIEKGADDFNGGLYHACEGGHKEIVELLITFGANDWFAGLEGANNGGHKELVKMMIVNGHKDDSNKLLINNATLDFDDIYELLQNNITEFGKYSNVMLECKKWKLEFNNVAKEIFNADIASVMVGY